MLLPAWCRVLELQQSSFDMIFHAGFECSVVTVPVQVDATVSGACPICFDGAVLLECIHQVFCILLSLVAESKIINNWCERDGPCLMEVQSWCVFGWEAAMLCKVLFELVVCQFALLTETTDGLPDLNANMAI